MPVPTVQTNSNIPAYSPGLDGVIAGETAICHVDANAGLLYRGYDIHELASRLAFEEIVYLLLYGELPTPPQLKTLRATLSSEANLPQAVIAMLRLLPATMHPVDLLRTGISTLAAFDPELNDQSHDANVRKSIRLISKMCTLATTGWRISKGLEPYAPPSGLDYSARFLFGLWGRQPEPWEVHAYNIILALYAEHDFNASTFSARVTASTLSDIYAAVTTALGTLKGPLHGGANEAALAVLAEVAKPDRAEAWVKDQLAHKVKVMGFGHRVYRTGDSRVPAVRELTRELGKRKGQEQWVAICEALEAAMEKHKKLYANLDLYAAPALMLLGIPSELNTSVFACSRVSGWCAHVVEQLDHNRIIRPRSIYTGPALRKLPGH